MMKAPQRPPMLIDAADRKIKIKTAIGKGNGGQ